MLLPNFDMEALAQLWEKYSGRFQDAGLNEIIARGYCFSEVSRKKVLVVGINPSFRQNESEGVQNMKCLSFRYDETKTKDSYFKQIRHFMGKLDEETTYMDLFNYRETVQKRLFTFLNDKVGVDFLAENLLISQLQIEREVQPKLIVVKNRDAWMFFGRYAEENNYRSAVWMGYLLKKEADTPCGEAFRIVGLVDNEQRIGFRTLNTTNLLGSIVLFTKHCQYLKSSERPTSDIIENLYNLSLKR